MLILPTCSSTHSQYLFIYDKFTRQALCKHYKTHNIIVEYVQNISNINKKKEKNVIKNISV